MGLDLYLLPFECDQETISFSHSILNCDRNYPLFEKIEKLDEQPVEKHFSSYLSRNDDYEEPHYGKTTETPYGEPLGWVKREKLLTFQKEAAQTPRCYAIWEYLNALPENTKVALYWH